MAQKVIKVWALIIYAGDYIFISGLLLEIGTFSETELEQIEKALPTFKEQEEQYKKHAQLWLRVIY